MATMTACPFCFHQVDSSQLWFQCLGNGNQECEKETDKAREKLTGSTRETFPSFPPPQEKTGHPGECPGCGGHTNLRACPDCHTALPSEFGDPRNPMLGFVGSKGSGKTVLMTVLAKQMKDAVGRRFNASIRIANDNPDGHQGISDYQANRENRLYEKHLLPLETDSIAKRGHAAPLLLRWQQEGKTLLRRPTVKSTLVSFIDTAGEDLNSQATAFTLHYLSACDGLIVVLDPFAIPGAQARLRLPDAAINVGDENPKTVLGIVTQKLRVERGIKPGRRIDLPVAVVFTKIDAFFSTLEPGNPLRSNSPAIAAYDDADGESVHEHMRALMDEWNAGDIDTDMRLNYKNYRYFGVSALGAEPDYEKNTVDTLGVRPHRVEDPVLWLLSKFGTVRPA